MHLEVTCDIHTPLYQEALRIRRAVFIEEQHIPEATEVDSLETHCLHTVLYTDDTHLAVATARILPLNETTWKIQRVAVLKSYRGKKIGHTLLNELIRLAIEKQITWLTLNAQIDSVGFYKTLGFEEVGELFFEAGIAHQAMKRFLD